MSSKKKRVKTHVENPTKELDETGGEYWGQRRNPREKGAAGYS